MSGSTKQQCDRTLGPRRRRVLRLHEDRAVRAEPARGGPVLDEGGGVILLLYFSYRIAILHTNENGVRFNKSTALV